MNQNEERWIEFEACRTVEDEEKEPNFDIFGDPDPYQIFPFLFKVPMKRRRKMITNSDTTTCENNDEDDSLFREISFSLKGLKHEHERIFESTGLTLWRASKLLCEFMCSNSHYIENKSVVELGAGLGLCGLLAYHLHASKVVMTDGDTDVLAEMRYNVESNLKDIIIETSNEEIEGQDKAGIRKKSEDIILCRQLRWGRNYTSPFKRSIMKSLNVGNEEEDDFYFDVIIASDVIYVEYVLDDLFDTIDGLLSPSEDATFLLGYARRAVDISLVFECAKKHGLKWREPNETEGVYIFSRDL